MTIFFTKKLLKQRKQNHPHQTTPRIFNKTCLQHEVLTKCCHPVAFSGPTHTFVIPAHRAPQKLQIFVGDSRRESIAPQGQQKHRRGRQVPVFFLCFATETYIQSGSLGSQYVL